MGNDEQEIDHESGSVEMEKCTLQKNCNNNNNTGYSLNFPYLRVLPGMALSIKKLLTIYVL